MENVVVIGGGAAGMLAAISAAKHVGEKSRIILLEKNDKLGKKIYITGKGRCNITNAADIETILSNIMTNYQFMYSSIYGFSNEDIVALLHEFGCKTKVERGERVFPVSDHSSDVIAALKRALIQYKVDIQLQAKVERIVTEVSKDSQKPQVCAVVLASGRRIPARKIIVATGGCSYPSTGSTGDGYRFAQDAGHHIVPLRPGLVPFETQEQYIKELQGLSLRNVKLTIYNQKKKCFQEQGEMLFTHFGVSGPLVLSASAVLKEKIEPGRITGEIDLKPALTEKQLDERILRDFKEAANKNFKNALDQLLPKKMIPVIVTLSGIAPEEKVHDIKKEQRLTLLTLLKHFPFTVSGLRGYEEAIITKGGVNVKEINPATMESNYVRGLHFAGEVLDLDAMTGGYNLQIAWSTGYAAGMEE